MDGWRALLPEREWALAEELLERNRALNERGVITYPPAERIMAAAELTPPERCRVIILGQDPYHEAGQANGLAFSTDPGAPIPRSLGNIFRELQADLGCPMPKDGDLSGWAAQGVLLLNTVLTVEAGQANSHKDWGWQTVVAALLRRCAERQPKPVLMLWGKQAAEFAEKVPGLTEGTVCLCSTHPSPLSARRGTKELPAFLGSRPFSRCNGILIARGEPPIRWEQTGLQ